jgi:hypothetical protein
MKLILYHGTSAANAKKILKEGFRLGKKTNWKVKSKPGFIYLSKAYAPFFAMNCKGSMLALVQVAVDTDDLYPDDDALMHMLGKPMYSQTDLDAVNFEKFKEYWEPSLKGLGSVAAKPDKVKVLGIKTFPRKGMINMCDPSITPMNYRLLGEYYQYFTAELYQGIPIEKTTRMDAFFKMIAKDEASIARGG